MLGNYLQRARIEQKTRKLLELSSSVCLVGKDSIMDPEEDTAGSGLQMLLDRWKLQEEQLQMFEESLKEVNCFMTNKEVQENPDSSVLEAVTQQSLLVFNNDMPGAIDQDSTFCLSSARSIASTEDGFGYNLRKLGQHAVEDTDTLAPTKDDESLEEYERRIWEIVRRDEDFLNANIGEGRSAFPQEAACTSSKGIVERLSSATALLPAEQLKVLKIAVDVEDKEPSPRRSFLGAMKMTRCGGQREASAFDKPNPSIKIEGDGADISRAQLLARLANVVDDCEQKQQIPNFMFVEELKEIVTAPLVNKCSETIRGASNVVNLESGSSSICDEEGSSRDELSEQRARIVEGIMAAEVQRQMEREKLQIRRNEALNQEAAAVANMEKFLKNQLQIEQEGKQGAMEQDDKLWQQRYEQEQRVYELQRELEFSNATLRKMTVTWEIYEEPPAKTKKLEEEEKNTTAQRIGRAFRERKRCRELVYCCTLIQKVFRGFLSRRIFRELKGQRSKIFLQEILKSTAKNREAAFKNLVRVSEISSPEEYESAMERALSLDLGEEVELIQERREAAKVEMSNWLRQVPASCLGSRSLIVSDKIKEARRLGLTTLAEATQAIMLEKENNILTELEISMRSGALKVFHQCQRKSKFFGLGEPVEKYSAEFRERVAMVQKRLMQASVRNYEANVLNLLLEGSDLGLETEVAAVVRNIRSQVLRFAKGLIEKISIFISKGDGFLEKWSELQSWGKVFGIGEDVLKSLMQAIGCSVLLEHTKVKRSLVVVLECDFMGRPVCYSCETQSAILNVKDLELKYSDSNIEASESVKRKFSGYVTIPSLDTYSKSWNKIGKLKNRWKNHCSQAFLKTLPSKRRAEPLGISKTQQDVVLKTHHHQSGAHYTREAIDISSVEENGVVDHVIDGDYWYTLRPHLRGMESSSSCTLTRKLLESSAHCNRTGLLGVTKLSIPHKELTSLGIGMLGRWCPKLRIFMINENRLSTLKGAFYGCEGSLEYVLVKDNLLNDLEGLESLQNLKVLFLEGNFISCIGSGTGVQIDSEEMNVAAAKTSGSSCLSTTPRASCRSYQGTPRIAEVRTDSTRRECVTSRDTNKHRASTLWPKLEKLSLGNNRISRIWELGSLFPNLEVLDLRSNELVTLGGYEGKGLSGLKHLRLLDVGQNKIKGRSLWNGLGHCQLLVSLVASRNRLTELPTHFGSVMLREIWLNGNCIRRLACKAWLPNLQRFYLQDNLIDNLESLYGCPSLEVLDISFNNVSQLTQLNHLASLRRLRTLQMNDNPISDQEDHVGKVLEAVPWLIELDNELVEDSFREKAVQSIFSKNMAVAGIRYLDEKIARAERPFLSFANPKDVTKHWLGGFSDRSDSSNQSGLAKLEANNRDIIAVMQGKAKSAVLWAAVFDLHRIAETNPILRTRLSCAMGTNLHPLVSLPCDTNEENWNHLAFQEMLESHRKSQSWSKETSLRKEFFGQESKSGPQMTKGTNLSNEGIMSVSHNVERYLSDHLEDEDFKYKNVFKENLEYKADIEVELSRVRRLQALARDMLTRKRLIKMQKLAVDVLAPREAHTEAERRRYQSSALRIQGAWRRWVRRKFMISVVKLQAYWRGIRTRKRFRQALSKLQFIDDDDFEYVAVDESEYTLDPTVFEKNFIPSKFRVSVEALVCLTKRFNMETSSKEEIQAKISNKEGCGSGSSENIDPWLTRSADKLRGTEVAIPYDFSQSDDMRIQNEEMETPSQSVKRLYRMKSTGSRFHLPKIEVAPTTAATPPLDASNSLITSAGEISIVVQNEVFQRSLKETPRCAIESDRKAKAHLCGKEVRAEKKKTTIAEIAKDWGFNDERTAEAYMKSRTKVMKKLEKVKAVHQGAQSRFELFKARSEETLAHSPQCVHVKKTAQRPRKIKHEVKDVPDEDTTSLDKFHGWSPSSAAADATNTTGHHLLFSGDDTRKHPCVSVLAVRRRDNRNCRR
ncbi:uncharacterized protein [Physcomitrium patens]|uniref:uncharacterized protein isoform X5 n=1 Tax=Physcomitrium patens TaxID=3218 RepID=UPI000D16032F|nr:uncharacterized protein LOC112278132 isoform X1 [Physcomitrium patens]XP_024367014.1 uncharacterized protein LOC112278132 isoform X1 [Physcomitrium patens]|eukprot:XP_024367013.1 uncharacterized protein LOC112278132 isoform X1 [Physcomitrella patens]